MTQPDPARPRAPGEVPLAAASATALPPFIVRARRGDEQLRTLAYEVTMAEARERERIATGLHDEIGQVLAIIGLKLGELGELGEGEGAPDKRRLVDELRELVMQAAQATRSATFELNSPVLHQLGLQAAVESLCARTQALCGVTIHLTGAIPALPVPDQVLAVVFRVFRELVANMVKHSRASVARVAMHMGDSSLIVALADDGQGFDAERPRVGFGPEGGYGLFSAEAQIQAIGGHLDIESRPGHGTRATIVLPLAAPAADGH